MANEDFKFNGTHCSTYNAAFIVDQWPIAPPALVNKVSIGGRHGTVRYNGRYYQERPLAGRLYLLGADEQPISYTDMMQRGANIANWLCREGRKQLILDAMPDRFYMAEVENELHIETTEWPNGQIPVVFTVQPFMFAVDATTATASLTANQAQTVALSVLGNQPAPLAVTFSASAPITWAQVAIGSKVFRLEGMNLTSDQMAVIAYDVANNELLSVTVAGAKGMKYVKASSTIPLCAAAGNNTVTLQADGACTATVSARGRWL